MLPGFRVSSFKFQVVLAFLLAAFRLHGAQTEADQFMSDVHALCRAPHRLAGTEECEEAARYVERQLRDAGIEDVFLQPFFVPQLQSECLLRVDGKDVPLFGMRANLWQGPTSGPVPIRGKTLIAGDGSPKGYGDGKVDGRIVVLNYETARRWRDAFAMGARAVIFVETGGTPLDFPRFENISARLPRFYVSKGDATACGLLDSAKEVSIEARSGWSRCEAHNVLAWIPGTDPVFSLEREEVLVLGAQLDSFGQVPYLAGGARGAANCAALLEMARRLWSERPRRSVLIAFLGGEGRLASGSAALYSAIFRAKPFLSYKRTHADFLREYEEENAFISQVIDVTQAEDVFSGKGEAGRQGLELLRREAEFHARELQSRLTSLRLERNAAKTEGDDKKLREAEKTVTLAKQEEDDWNDLRRALAEGTMEPELEDHLGRIRRSAASMLQARREEIEAFVRQRRSYETIARMPSGKTVVLHLTVDFGDKGPRWGVAHYDRANELRGGQYNNVGYYVGVFAALSDLVDELREQGSAGLRLMEPETTKLRLLDEENKGAGGKGDSGAERSGVRLRLIEPETTKIQLGPPVFFPGTTLHGGQVASRFGIYGLRLGTCHDRMALRGHPQDRPGNVDFENIKAFAFDAIPLVKAIASAPSMSLRQRIRPTASYEEPRWANGRTEGYNVMMRSAGSAIANRPARGSMLALHNLELVPGFDLAPRYVVQQNGYFALGPVPPRKRTREAWCCALFDAHGRISSVNSEISNLRRVEMFPCLQCTVVALSPPEFRDAKSLILNATNDGQFPTKEFFFTEMDTTTTFFAPVTAKGVKVINNFGIALLNADAEHPSGRGLAVGDDWRPPSTEYYTANDLCALNEHRLDILRQRRITNDSLEWLHGLANTALRKGRQAQTTAVRFAEFGIARLLSRRVYDPILTSMNDLVKAVVILLLLTIPFAFALERLLVGTPHIYRQIGWYCLFFLITFAVLYKVHPAFAIATEPIVIFLAFIIVILSSIVIFILLGRFQSEIRAVQGLRATVHSADVSRFGTVMAAVAMGISTMRRRPVRTLLTTVTVILLTFSILSFASFDARGGILRQYVASTEDIHSIFIHHSLWSPLWDRFVDIVRHIAGEHAVVTERRWVAASSSGQAETFSLLVADEKGKESVRLKALVGLEQVDIDGQPDLKACLPTVEESGFTRGSILLPPVIAERLGVEIGDNVMASGHSFTFAGCIDVERLTRFVQIDKTPIFPVDYGDESLRTQKKQSAGTSKAESMELANLQSESAFLPYYSANQVGIIHSEAAREIEGELVGVGVYTEEDADMDALAQRLARISWAPVHVTLSDGVYRLYFTTVLATYGLSNLIIPIVLGGLIVFGTMLGSVTDREKEIYSFSALGLAPAHIGMLFFAEASVYAVVGGLGGYILAQVVAFVTGWLSSFTAIKVPEMNYSSTNAIFAILVVMATVLLSTVYPALRGSRSANPGVARVWRLPKPNGDVWEFTFPFTVSDYDITGVMSFLHEHFNNFSDCSLGVFLAENTSVYTEGKTLNLASRVATAPFDLGVTQEFQLTSLPSEIEGVDEVRIVVKRRSGTRGDWQRTNRPFISDLRKQFLIWRSLPTATMELYRRKTLAMLGKQEADDGRQTADGKEEQALR